MFADGTTRRDNLAEIYGGVPLSREEKETVEEIERLRHKALGEEDVVVRDGGEEQTRSNHRNRIDRRALKLGGGGK